MSRACVAYNHNWLWPVVLRLFCIIDILVHAITHLEFSQDDVSS